jgi:hypothetical protein
VVGVAAVFSVAAVVDDQHPLVVGAGRRVVHQQLQPPLVELLVIPGRLRQEELQALHGRMLRADHGFGAGQAGQGLVAVAGQQALQVGAQAAALGERAKQRVKLGGVVLQRARAGGQGRRLVIAAPPLPAPMGQPSTFPLPTSANKLPLKGSWVLG